MRDDTSTAERSPERFPVIYIAGPYTAGDPAANVHRAVDVAHYLMDHGLAWPLVPHLSHSPCAHCEPDWASEECPKAWIEGWLAGQPDDWRRGPAIRRWLR